MSKKQIAKKYLREHVDFAGLTHEWKHSWLSSKPKSWLFTNGLSFQYFYAHQKKAIEVAGYKHPHSDRTWLTMNAIQRELIEEIIF
ncbi:hypothetical protein P7G87_00285 [Enterococcus asini]|uniref:hypothetical protein n=1 Tax=Enterococcus asini TaxID=57732 RepID=UPI00288F6376|nr:hypothetical protein [Enterococcus asini]MDT2783124.1 hypothetical protein [Enterococcus asini]